MTTIQLARRAVRLFSNSLAPLHTNKYNRRAWLSSVRMLGDKWIVRAERHIKRENGNA